MIIHHSEPLKEYHVCVDKPLKYSDKFTFIPIKLQKETKYHKCIFQTPLLFTPFGSQVLMNGKQVIDLSFHNKGNDKAQLNFLKTLTNIYQCVNHKYNDLYKVNRFLKITDFDECIRLKLNDNTSLYDENKNKIKQIDKFTYGFFIIELEGMWLNENKIWFQWNLLQARVNTPTHLSEYSFIDELKIIKKADHKNDKYDKMIKLGVPKDAVNMQKMLDGLNKIPPPPPPPMPINGMKSTASDIPKISALDLKSVVLKKRQHMKAKKIIKEHGSFEPPTLEELQTTLSRLRPTK